MKRQYGRDEVVPSPAEGGGDYDDPDFSNVDEDVIPTIVAYIKKLPPEFIAKIAAQLAEEDASDDTATEPYAADGAFFDVDKATDAQIMAHRRRQIEMGMRPASDLRLPIARRVLAADQKRFQKRYPGMAISEFICTDAPRAACQPPIISARDAKRQAEMFPDYARLK